jgi:hypothetical protein
MTEQEKVLRELVLAIRFHFRPLVEDFVNTDAAHCKDDLLERAAEALKDEYILA